MAVTIRRIGLATRFVRNLAGDIASRRLSVPDAVHWIQQSISYQFLPRLIVLEEDSSDRTQLLRLNTVDFWWPSEYSTMLLGRVWNEVFLPWPSNSHAYENAKCSLSSGDTVLDCGACEGFFSAHALDKGCRVFAVEALPRLCYCLSKTFAREIEEGKLTVLNFLLGETASGVGRVIFEGSPLGAKAGETGEVVPATSIDRLRESDVLPRLSFIKMDIEGSETAALKGARSTLKSDQPTLSLAAYHNVDDSMAFGQIIEGSCGEYDFWTKGRARLQTHVVPKIFHAVSKAS